MTLITKSLGKINSFVVYSDVHLREPDDNMTELFINSLSNIKDVDAVFFLGDIFDFIFNVKTYYKKRWSAVFSAFAKLHREGVKVVFVEGNHDFGFHHFTREEFYSYAGDAVLSVDHPVLGEVILRHGDDVVCPPSYLWFRAIVKSRALQIFARIFPGFILQFIFSKHARLSRAADKYKRISREFLYSCISKYLDQVQAKPQVLILGHVHVHVDEVIQNSRVIIGPDWFNGPSYLLVEENGSLKRIFLRAAPPPLFPLMP